MGIAIRNELCFQDSWKRGRSKMLLKSYLVFLFIASQMTAATNRNNYKKKTTTTAASAIKETACVCVCVFSPNDLLI